MHRATVTSAAAYTQLPPLPPVLLLPNSVLLWHTDPAASRGGSGRFPGSVLTNKIGSHGKGGGRKVPFLPPPTLSQLPAQQERVCPGEHLSSVLPPAPSQLSEGLVGWLSCVPALGALVLGSP